MPFVKKTIKRRQDVPVPYEEKPYRTIQKYRFDPYKEEPIKNAGGLCHVLRRVTNEDPVRLEAVRGLCEVHPRVSLGVSSAVHRWGRGMELHHLRHHDILLPELLVEGHGAVRGANRQTEHSLFSLELLLSEEPVTHRSGHFEGDSGQGDLQ